MIEKKPLQGRFGSNPFRYIWSERNRWNRIKTNYVSIRADAFDEYGIVRMKKITKDTNPEIFERKKKKLKGNEHIKRRLQETIGERREKKRREKVRSYYQEKNKQDQS